MAGGGSEMEEVCLNLGMVIDAHTLCVYLFFRAVKE